MSRDANADQQSPGATIIMHEERQQRSRMTEDAESFTESFDKAMIR